MQECDALSTPPPLLHLSIGRVAPYKSAWRSCKSPNESSSVKWLNGPDKSPNEEINNWVVGALLILIRRFQGATIPARTRPFFTARRSARQQLLEDFFLFSSR